MSHVKWEYKSILVDVTPGVHEKAERYINDIGGKGWELVAIVPVENQRVQWQRFYFKRKRNFFGDRL